MAHVAEQIETLVGREEDRAARAAEGTLPSKEPQRFHHMMMSGPPGTGKTTVAREMGKVLKDLGVASTTNFKDTHASKLVGQYRGDAQKNMLDAIEEAKGGVLFIDEAHQLADSEYGRQALRTLIQPMADPSFDTTVIFAGYPKDLQKLYKVDEGLRSRVPTDLKFERFTGEQLSEFAMREIEESRNLKFQNDAASDAMADALDVIGEDPAHASMRDAKNLIDWADDARIRRNMKVKKKPIKNRNVLVASDFEHALDVYRDQRAS